ncbi:K+-transporting ATPase ATPase A chain [Variovorax beijingensis]|uniref:Potassium-transporting ATPase potassium-binding subunit n=2 Tax=Variovorax TaxID=34072 RepID=A0AAE4BWM7_VARPD|nr:MULTISPECIES: potassium-transporting ATPase subunit KdpA [Variovorax]MBD9666732.1 potassium-transporting ATPase subunit KdpA [Variovorax sp. VRV01]MDP9965757.1 K+-transporting ATPase ATPase A chain [Variovorax paradoxus]MDR6425883.1 K+-transporting ATPase ATPase A chain [Variovorax paradoxus]MDR6452877.1 K+-transporting ATPase ATPase A chain [Variovorax paradoxus]TWD90888.1 K+-transporting ATPase ATPase A chain [Variovorax beijingensis]
MTSSAWGLLALFLAALLVLAWPVGKFLAALCNERVPRWMQRVEAPLYRLAGTRPEQSMHWLRYALALVAFNAVGAVFVYALQRLQGWLPLNPAGMGAISPDSAFNTAVSFVSNTNWQGYGGESAMSYLTQMLGLAVQNFFSAATGIAVAFALIRGFARRGDGKAKGLVGNFWADLTRITLWVLVPLSFVLAVFFVSQGAIQNFEAYKTVETVEATAFQQPKNGADGQPLKNEKGEPVMEDATTRTQTLAMGPVASQEAIKMLGTNGGGFFNANSAHPYENPTALSNLLQMLAIFLIPAALCFTFGRVVGDLRQGWAVLAAMTVMFVAAVMVVIPAEQAGNPLFGALGVDQLHGVLQSGGNMEGKEVRFGIDASALFAAVTTAASCGAVIAMHDSFTPLGGMVPMVLMQLGEVVFGGVGSGLYGMLIFAMLAVFIAGLMIGRTPEYLGKKIEVREMKLISIAILVTPVLVLAGTAMAVLAGAGKAGIANPGAHGFSEILYALSSAANNNGSAFAGLSANTPFYNGLLGLAMWLGRFAVIVPVLAIAGSLAAKQRLPVTGGTLPTHGPLFVSLLIGTVLLVGLLNYVPALALGPVVEHLVLWK